MASRLLFLSQWSRQTGLEVIVVKDAAAKRASLRACETQGLDRFDGGRWMPDEDSNLD
ncbi:MAG: hypothetical protein ABIR60_06810 [Allosphingosinicella sp.]